MRKLSISKVYAQVTILFKGATDLLDEFKQFLPDVSNSQPSEQRAYLGYGRRGIKEITPLDAGQGKKKRATPIQIKASGSSDNVSFAYWASQGAKRSKLHHPLSVGISDIRSDLSFDESAQPIISPDEVEFFDVSRNISAAKPRTMPF